MSNLIPKNVSEVESFANYLFKSSLANSKFKTAHDVGYVIIYALEKDIPITEAVQQYSIMKRRSKTGDVTFLIAKSEVLLSQVKRSGLLEYYHEEILGSFDDGTAKGVVTVQRKKEDKKSFIFTTGDAKKARLWGRQGPWTDYPQRMLVMRARGFALRDVFADVLSGAYTYEEARDISDETDIEVKNTLVEEKTEDQTPEKENKDMTDSDEDLRYSELFDDFFEPVTEEGSTSVLFKSGVKISQDELDEMKELDEEKKKKLYNDKLLQLKLTSD